MGHEFYVDKNVLVPRQDTETLVESALECMKAVKNPYILDMCTGSGCILISILKERADAHGTGVDLSDEALKVAVRNARTLEVAEHAEFVQSNLFSEMQNIVYGTEYMKRTAVKDTVKMTECENSNRNYSRAYDMIISNPPYIPTAEIEDLMDEVNCMIRVWRWMVWKMDFIFTGLSRNRHRIILFRVVGFYMKSDAARRRCGSSFAEI